MKKLLIIFILLLISGCSTDIERNKAKKEFTPIDNRVHSVTTPTGVDCVIYSFGYRGGISCNWEKYNKEQGK